METPSTRKPSFDEENKNIDNSFDENDCSVCMFEKTKIVLPCMHAFCEKCI